MSVELYQHQNVALSLLRLNDGFALFMEQGTGKTFPVLVRLAELAHQGKIASALVAAPKYVCAGWEDKIAMLSDGQRADLASIDLRIESYDKVWRSVTKATRYDAVVFDESHYLKTPSAKRTKACTALASRARYRYILTGTPVTNGHLCDLWSQMACVCPVVVKGRVYPECFGGDSYYAWIERAALLDRYRKPWRYVDIASIQATVADHSYRITKEECLDLPEKMPDDVWHVPMPASTRAAYGKMARDSAVADLGLLAPNPVSRMTKLRQMCSGHCAGDDGEVVLECLKTEVLRQILSCHEGKAVVFCEFRKSMDDVCALLSSMGVVHVRLDGATDDRSCWKRFQDDPSVGAIVCQYQCGGAGIDLYAADLEIFYEPTLASVLNEQAKDRIHRIGQRRACSYAYMLTERSIEEQIYRALRSYRDFDENLFERYIATCTMSGGRGALRWS